MQKLPALLLLLPFLIQSEEETFEQCIAIPLDEESSSAYEACFEKFEILNTGDCIDNHIEFSGKTEDDAGQICLNLLMKYEIQLYMEDRPSKEYLDVFDVADNLEMKIKSYGCSVPKTEEGLDAYNALVKEYDGNPLLDESKLIEEEWYIQKAIIHMLEDMSYAEVNFGDTIYPLAAQRFFTNVYMKDEDRLIGAVDNSRDSEYLGGTDIGVNGRGWMINETNNMLSIYMGNFEIVFFDECEWNDIDIEELEALD